MHRNHAHAFVLALAGLVMTGCTSLVVGRPIDKQKVNEILPGRTSKTEIKTWFGEPLRTVQGPDGEIYVYRYMDGEGACDELVVSFSSEYVQSMSAQ